MKLRHCGRKRPLDVASQKREDCVWPLRLETRGRARIAHRTGRMKLFPPPSSLISRIAKRRAVRWTAATRFSELHEAYLGECKSWPENMPARWRAVIHHSLNEPNSGTKPLHSCASIAAQEPADSRPEEPFVRLRGRAEL